jgi:hypothetical protein
MSGGYSEDDVAKILEGLPAAPIRDLDPSDSPVSPPIQAALAAPIRDLDPSDSPVSPPNQAALASLPSVPKKLLGTQAQQASINRSIANEHAIMKAPAAPTQTTTTKIGDLQKACKICKAVKTARDRLRLNDYKNQFPALLQSCNTCLTGHCDQLDRTLVNPKLASDRKKLMQQKLNQQKLECTQMKQSKMALQLQLQRQPAHS